MGALWIVFNYATHSRWSYEALYARVLPQPRSQKAASKYRHLAVCARWPVVVGKRHSPEHRVSRDDAQVLGPRRPRLFPERRRCECAASRSRPRWP
ncbi:hypothetical protein EMIT0158MI4_270048 [Burkholderia ambifaria]